MSNSPDIIPSEPAELREFTVGLLAELKNRDLLIEKLRHQVAGQNTHRFGSKAEDIDQLQLRLEDEEVAEAAATPLKQPKQADEDTKAKPKRKPLPDHLPRVEHLLSVGDACTDCELYDQMPDVLQGLKAECTYDGVHLNDAVFKKKS